ncbi:MAG: DUF6524 family protein [Candidatus Eisenbacteria bacterium]|uniref:Uncharacterized protein n=1 Tax=Eiseniibacteriota bacterium TaxID=2212470 RepID=A0A956M138_UNCEI|nr:hypothetical protein [Candidatus Eisenbacteria bacterium]
MASQVFGAQAALLRFLFALVLVFMTYNPSGVSYVGWLTRSIPDHVGPVLILAGVVLAIGWTVFIRAARQSLGLVGFVLTVALFGTLLWLLIDVGIVPRDSVSAIAYAVLVLFAGILAVGMSWSHLRRRFSGQVDVDRVD